MRACLLTLTLTGCVSATTLPLDELRYGDLVLTEIMADPLTVSDDEGEWIEVYNPGQRPIDLAGLEIEDEAGNRGYVDDPVLLWPGEYQVLGRGDATRFSDDDVSPIGFYGYEPALNNDGDQVWLAGPSGVLDSSVRYPSATPGVALQLSPYRVDATSNDDPRTWCDASGATFSGHLATPGRANDPCL